MASFMTIQMLSTVTNFESAQSIISGIAKFDTSSLIEKFFEEIINGWPVGNASKFTRIEFDLKLDWTWYCWLKIRKSDTGKVPAKQKPIPTIWSGNSYPGNRKWLMGVFGLSWASLRKNMHSLLSWRFLGISIGIEWAGVCQRYEGRKTRICKVFRWWSLTISLTRTWKSIGSLNRLTSFLLLYGIAFNIPDRKWTWALLGNAYLLRRKLISLENITHYRFLDIFIMNFMIYF